MRALLKFAFRTTCVAGVLAATVSTVASAQEFTTDEQKSFYQSYRNLLDASDFRSVPKLVDRDQRTGEQVLDVLGLKYLLARDVAVLDEMRPLAKAMDDKQGGSRFDKRLAYLEAMDAEAQKTREEGLDLLRKANGAYEQARQKKDKGLYRQALSSFDEALTKLEKAGDNEWVSFARMRLGYCHEQLSEYYEAVVAYDKGMDDWMAAGRPKADQDYAYMTDKRRELIDKGYDPDKDAPSGADVPGGAKPNTMTSFAEGSEWTDWTTEYKKMKKPTDLASFSPFYGDKIHFWRQVGFKYDSVNKLECYNELKPFDAAVQLVREGAQGMIDIDGDGKGDAKAKVIDNKPSLTEFDDGSGRGAQQYALWIATGGNSLTWLGQQVNYQELAFYRPACYREGKVEGETLRLIDENASGILGDVPADRRDGVVRGYPRYEDLDGMALGKSKTSMPFSQVFAIGEQWYRLRLSDPRGEKLKTRAMNLESGQVQVQWDGPTPPTSLVIGEVRELQGAYFDVAGKKPVTVPVGRYEIAVGKIEGGRKSNPQLVWIFKGDSKPFEVKAGEVTTLEMGGPYRFDFQTEDAGREFKVLGKSIVAYDKFGAIVGRNAPDVLFPEVSVRAESGGMLAKGDEMRMITTKEFNQDSNRAWYPADFVLEKSAKAKCQAQLSLKKHPVLGGPFESEWQ